jgi:ectoine hydroxylase-related dioxygenase (phytanoyl-CoA dioxygenase family)
MNINSYYQLSENHIRNYRNNGFVHLPNLCSLDEIDYYGTHIRKVVKDRKKYESLNEPKSDEYFMQILNLRFDCIKVREYALSERFGRIAVELMGVDSVRIFHDQILFKKPRSQSTPFHQDLVYWPLDTKNAMGMWMALCEVTIDMGPIKFAKGSHKNGLLSHHAISDQSEEYFDGIIDENGYEIVSIPMRAGDATFHNGFLIHGAAENKTDTIREAMIVTFFEDGTRVITDNDHRKNDARIYLDDCKNGDKAKSKINPVIWSQSW